MSSLDRIKPSLASSLAARCGAPRAAWTAAALAMGGVAPDAMADQLVHSVSSSWGPATALSLTLVTAIIRSQK